MNNPFKIFQLSGRLSLMMAILIFGSAGAVTRKITEIGAAHLIDGRNPISFCNFLFVGNLCAFILLGVIYFHQWRSKSIINSISIRSWIIMALVAALGTVITPTLTFSALEITTVNNVILIGQLDAPLVLVLSIWFFKDKVNIWVIAGAVLTFIGISLTVLLKPPEAIDGPMMLDAVGKGELFVVIAAMFKAIANIINRINLKEIPLGIFMTFRMGIGTSVFLALVMTLYGPEHLMDVGSPFLWQWMIVYSAVIVVAGQLLWFSALPKSSASEVSLANAFNPIAGVLAAYFILQEAPTMAQYVGGSVVLLGIAFNQWGVIQLKRSASQPRQISDKEIADSCGFKGI